MEVTVRAQYPSNEIRSDCSELSLASWGEFVRIQAKIDNYPNESKDYYVRADELLAAAEAMMRIAREAKG